VTLAPARPLLFQVIVVDSHMELAAIFWASIAMVQMNAGQSIRDSIEEETLDMKKDLIAQESRYFDALRANIDAHEKTASVPALVRAMNVGERALRVVEAAATTRRVQNSTAADMVAALDYLVMTQGSAEASADSDLAVTAQAETEKKLAEDSKAQAASIADAIAALKAGGAPQAGNTTEKLFVEAVHAYKTSPPKKDAAAEAADREKSAEIFSKRFGYTQRVVTAEMAAAAAENAAVHAELTSKCGGAAPVEGAAITNPNPLDFMSRR
jgi:hypothetical protein